MREDRKTGIITAPSLVVIGPSGSGKSTLGKALADELSLNFLEGDDYHPIANLAKMARGESLDDQDREPYLDALGRALARQEHGFVAACSALKRSHRDRLLRYDARLLFIWPQVKPDELARRISARGDHFMPLSLLASQLNAFETPQSDENCLVLDPEHPLAEQVRMVEKALAPVWECRQSPTA